MAFLNFELEINMTMNYASQSTGTLVDALGEANAFHKSADRSMREIKAVLIERHGEGQQEGEDFSTTAIHPLRTTHKWEAIARKFAEMAKLSDRQIKKVIDENSDTSDYWQVLVKPRIVPLIK
jgi:hypothetical protein